jgi:uncharacterized protein (DUF58 family)
MNKRNRLLCTDRALVLLLPAMAPATLSLFRLPWTFVTVGYFAVWTVLLIVDRMLLPRRDALCARRLDLSNFIMGVSRRLRIEIVNRSSRAARLQVKDAPPPEFDAPDRLRSLALPAFGRAVIEYEALSHVRGAFRFGDVYLRVRGPLGLVERPQRIPAETPVEVTPDVDAVGRRRLALELGSRVLFGRSRSRYIQRGTDFARHREYSPGDDYRHISWKATARRSRLIVREFEAERSQTVFIMLDAGRMMTTRIGDYSRMDYAVNAALQLSAACLAKGDLVGLAVFSSTLGGWLPPRKGRSQWRRIVEFLSPVQPDRSEPDYGRAYAYFLSRIKRRSLVVTFTDLANLGSSGAMVRYNLLLARRHLPLIVSIEDSDVVAAALRRPSDVDAVYSRAVACELVEGVETTLARLDTRGVLTVHVPADRLSTATVNRYLEVKYRGLL